MDYEKISAHALLAGLFSEYKNSKMGGTIYSIGLTHDFTEGFKIWHTDVSSNNLNSLRLQQQFGYKIESVSDVYVKHYKY